MRERFSDLANSVLRLAHHEAAGLGHSFTDTGHLLLGLLQVQRGVAAYVLTSPDLSMDLVRRELLAIIPPDRKVEIPQKDVRPHSPRVRMALEAACAIADSMESATVCTEHLLLGLLSDRDGRACQLLQRLGIDPEGVRSKTLGLLRQKQEDVSFKLETTEGVVSQLSAALIFMNAVGGFQRATELLRLAKNTLEGPHCDEV